jgi:aminoglycoside phosphotransferase (APT) family kinase protein
VITLDTSLRAGAARVLSAALPQYPTRGLRLLSAGEERDTWAAGDVVVRFPRSEIEAKKVECERALHPLLRAQLGDIVPAIAEVGMCAEFPYPVVAYERARGRQGQTHEGPIIRPKPWARTRLAGELAAARKARTAGAPVHKVDLRGVDVSEEAIAWARRIAGDAVDAFLVDPMPPGSKVAAKGVLCHGDLKGEHLFVSQDGTRLVAIIDWTDAAIADPALDLGGLVIWLGPSFVREVLQSYGGPADEGTADRAIFLGRGRLLTYLDGVLAGTEGAPPRGVVEAQLRAAFGD